MVQFGLFCTPPPPPLQKILVTGLVRGKLSLTLSPEYPVVRNPTCFLSSLLCFIIRITEYTWQSSVAKKKQLSSNNNESFEVRVQSQVGIDGRRFVHRKKTFKKVRKTRNRNGANAQKRVTIQFNATVLQSIFGILRSPKNNVRFEGSRANSTRYRCTELNSALIHPATEANSFLVCTH